jgi:glutathione synthase
MDPLEKIRVAGDSTFVTMREHTDRGFPTWTCTPDRMYARDGWTRAVVRPVRTTATAPYFHLEEPVDLSLGEFDVVWMRKDPPFDMTYVFATYLLDMVPERTLVVNGAHGLKLFNEKMWVMAGWPHLQPTTLVANDIPRVREFVAGRPGRVVLKPWDGNGGRGVIVTHKDDRNLPSIVELLTDDGRHYVIAQDFVPEVEKGDKRILLFDGDPVGAMLRVPTARDHRANMHAGGEVRPCALDADDLAICSEIAPALRQWGMVFVGIDVIGNRLTEINVTSPTGIQEMNRLYGWKLEADLVDRVAAKVAQRAGR